MKYIFSVLFLISTFVLADEPPQKMKIYFDCYLQYSHISCDDLRNSIFHDSKMYEPTAKNENPSVQIIMRDQQAQDGANVIIDYIAVKPLPNFKVQEFYAHTVSHDNQNLRALESIKHALGIMTEIQSADASSDGTVTISFKKGEAPAQDKTNSYFSLNGNVFASTGGGNSSDRYSFNAYYNYSGDKWRVQVLPNISFSKSVVKISENGDTLSAESFTYNGTIITSYLIDGHWNVGMTLSKYHSPTSNEDQMLSVTAGVEWLLVPFLQTDGKTLVFHYGVGHRNGRLIFANSEDKTELSYYFHYLIAMWAWHFEMADVSVYAGTSTLVSNINYIQFFGGGGLNYYLTKNKKLSANLDVNIGYNKKSITEPKVIDYSNPLATQMASGRSGLSTFFSIGITYNIGNSVRKGQDLRFKNY